MIFVDWTVVVSLPDRGERRCWCQVVCVGPGGGGVAIAALGCSLPQSLLYAMLFLSWLEELRRFLFLLSYNGFSDCCRPIYGLSYFYTYPGPEARFHVSRNSKRGEDLNTRHQLSEFSSNTSRRGIVEV